VTWALSVSYDRVLEVESQLTTAVCKYYVGVFVLANLQKGLYTVGALDNLDHNPSSITAKGSFHRTGIGLFKFLTFSNLGGMNNDIKLSSEKNYN